MLINRMITRTSAICFLLTFCAVASAQTDPTVRTTRFEAEQLVIGYRAHIGELQDEVARDRFKQFFADGATHEFDFPGFGDQNVNLSVEEYIQTFQSLRASSPSLRLIEFIPGEPTALRAVKTTKFIRTTACEENSMAAFAEFEVEFSFVATADGLKIAHVEAKGNPSMGGSIGAIEQRMPGRAHDSAELPSYEGIVRSSANGNWMRFNSFIEHTGGLPTEELIAESGVQFCPPDEHIVASDDWAEFLRRWQDCEGQEGSKWMFFTWRDELQVSGNLYTLAGDAWSADLLPSSFESDRGFSMGLKYSIWMPLKSSRWNWGIHGGVNLVTLGGISSWDETHWQQNAIDPDGMSYQRMTTASGLIERVTLNSLMLEAGAGVERRLGHRGPMLFSELGLGLFNPTSIISESESTIYHAGYYPDFHGVTIDHPEVYDFGYHSGTGNQDIQGNAALYAKGLVGMRYILPAGPSFTPTLTMGLGLIQTISPWFVSADSNWIQDTTDIISPLSTNASSSIRSRYWHLGLGVPLFTPDCTD